MNTYREVRKYEECRSKLQIFIICLMTILLIVISKVKIDLFSDKGIMIKNNEIYATCTNNCTHLSENKILVNGKVSRYKGIWFDEHTCKIVLDPPINSMVREVKMYKGKVSMFKSFLNILRTKGET